MSWFCCVVRFVTPVTSRLVTTIQPWRQTTWSTSELASGVASLVLARTSDSPMLTEPARTWLRPVPEPPPLTVIVAPGHSAAYAVAASWISGWRAVEPEVVMVPVTQLAVGAGVATGAVDAATDAMAAAGVAGVGVSVGSAVGVAPVELQAAANIAAAMARAPKLRVPLINSVSPLAGQLTQSTCSQFRGNRQGAGLTRCWRFVNVRGWTGVGRGRPEAILFAARGPQRRVEQIARPASEERTRQRRNP